MIEQLLFDNRIKAKEKVSELSKAFLDDLALIDEAIELVSTKKDIDKANVMEAIELATREKKSLANEIILQFALKGVASGTPRLQWESARVLGNTASEFRDYLPKIIASLFSITDADGTVVRWSAAFALGEIILLKSDENKTLIPKVETIIDAEEKNSIRKIYQSAIKKVNKS